MDEFKLTITSCLLIIICTNGVLSFNGTVSTRNGKLEGYTMTSRGGRVFWAFSGIPYAKPPVGKLRFQPPVPAEPWIGIRPAKEDGPYCIQWHDIYLNPEVRGVEDCLYLTLYTHDVNRRVPVIVHIHGGGFHGGDGARLTKPNYLMDEDVVIVDINFRLTVFGFLSFGDTVMPGNQGLKDQVMALKWVQDNIEKFGGDPHSVTITGESSGGMSIGHHIVSPLTRGLFHKAIAESGTNDILTALTTVSYARSIALRMVHLVGCSGANTAELVACLQSKNATELAGNMAKYRIWQIDPIITFNPVLEPNVPGAFLVGPISRWKRAHVPLLLGTTSAEGLQRTQLLLNSTKDLQLLNDNFNKLAPFALRYFHVSSNPQEVAKQVSKYYYGDNEISLNNWKILNQMFTDILFRNAIIETANKHGKWENVYFYYFDYVGEYTLASGNRIYQSGAFHQDEIIYFWYDEKYSPLKGQDLELSKILVKLWTNFAKFGEPTPSRSGLKWEPWDVNSKYLLIDKAGLRMRNKFITDRYRLWLTLPFKDLLRYERT